MYLLFPFYRFPDTILNISGIFPPSMNEVARKIKKVEIEAFFGAFGDDSGEWGGIEMRIYAARNKSRSRKVPKF